MHCWMVQAKVESAKEEVARTCQELVRNARECEGVIFARLDTFMGRVKHLAVRPLRRIAARFLYKDIYFPLKRWRESVPAVMGPLYHRSQREALELRAKLDELGDQKDADLMAMREAVESHTSLMATACAKHEEMRSVLYHSEAREAAQAAEIAELEEAKTQSDISLEVRLRSSKK